jgi:hypothetical protein
VAAAALGEGAAVEVLEKPDWISVPELFWPTVSLSKLMLPVTW